MSSAAKFNSDSLNHMKAQQEDDHDGEDNGDAAQAEPTADCGVSDASRATACTASPAAAEAAAAAPTTGFGDIHGPKTYRFIGFGDIHGPKPYKFAAENGSRLPTRGRRVARKASNGSSHGESCRGGSPAATNP